MEDGGEFDPATTEDKTTGGASGGNDDNPQDWQFPKVPEDTSDTSEPKRKFRWLGGARPKREYDRIPMSEFPKEKGTVPPPKGGEGTAETSFTDEGLNYAYAEISLANEKLVHDYPRYGKSGNLLNLEYIVDKKGKGKVNVIGPQGGSYPFFKADGETLNPGLPKAVLEVLRPKSTEVIQQNEEKIESLNKEKEENQEIADNENEEPAVRKHARDKVRESNEEISQLENTNERLRKKLPLRERLKALFKKYGFTVTTVIAAVGLTIGVLVNRLTNAAIGVTNAVKDVTNNVGNGLKELGKKIGSILPGLVGAIASFVFRTAGQVI